MKLDILCVVFLCVSEVICGNKTDNVVRVRRQMPKIITHCEMRFNEINTDTPSQQPSLFIELIRVCVEGPQPGRSRMKNLDDYFLVMLETGHSQDISRTSVVLYADLSKLQLKPVLDSALFTIGERGLEGIDAAFQDGFVRSIFKNVEWPRYLPEGNDKAYALILIDAKNTRKADINWMSLVNQDGRYLKRVLTPERLQMISQMNIKDMIVYGKKIPVSTCTDFNLLWPNKDALQHGKTYFLRDWDAPDYADFSLNRCTGASNEAFVPEQFQYDKPSPGSLKSCKGKYFFVEQQIQRLASMYESPTSTIPGCSAQYPGVSSGRYEEIDTTKLAELKLADVRGTDRGLQTEISSYAMEINTCNRELEEGNVQTVDAYYNYMGTLVDQTLIEIGRQYLPNGGGMLHNKDIQNWLRIDRHDDPNRPITFYCGLCVKYFEDGLADPALGPSGKDIMKRSGFFSSRKTRNSEEIIMHPADGTHMSAAKYIHALAATNAAEEVRIFREMQESELKERLKATENMIRTVFAEVFSEIPFYFHKNLVDLQATNGVQIGQHHYNADAAHLMSVSISSKMHEIFVKRMVETNNFASVILDTTTTTRNVPFLIIYFQTLEDFLPTVYYYALLELDKGETASELFGKFWEKVQADDRIAPGFENYIKNKLIFMISDGANVNSGPHNSFLVYLRRKLGKEIPIVLCHAHKLSLVLKASLKDKDDPDFKFIKSFEKKINSFYQFYASRGSRRWSHLTMTAEDYGFTLQTFKKNIEVRWSAAEKRVVESILQNWKAVEKDLQAIINDKSFTKPAREQAVKLYASVTDLSTVLLLHEFQDMLNINSALSVLLQEQRGILLDHAPNILDAIEKYRVLKIAPGKSLSSFLATCACSGVCEAGSCTLQRIEECANPQCSGIKLNHAVPPEFKLYLVREKIYEKTLAEFNSRFDMGLLSKLHVLDNRDGFFGETFEFDTFKQVCSYLLYPEKDCNSLSQQFYLLIQDVRFKSSIADTSEVSKPSLFWPHILVLAKEGKIYSLTDGLKEFLERVLVWGSTSAEAERGFSVVTRLTSGLRSSISAESVDALLRIKINGEKPIKDVKAFVYAKHWTTTGHFAVDDEKCPGRKRSETFSENQERKSRYF